MSRYDDILYREHHVSRSHPHMSMIDRAAQISPFAALTGYDESIDEAKRLTDEQRFLGESDSLELDYKFQYLESIISKHPEVTIIYFQKDEKKEGGKYLSKTGKIRKIDTYENILMFMDKEKIDLHSIMNIESDELKGL